jgi:hypothetical protein
MVPRRHFDKTNGGGTEQVRIPPPSNRDVYSLADIEVCCFGGRRPKEDRLYP